MSGPGAEQGQSWACDLECPVGFQIHGLILPFSTWYPGTKEVVACLVSSSAWQPISYARLWLGVTNPPCRRLSLCGMEPV